MSTALQLSAWNIEGRLSRFARAGRRGSPERVVAEIGRFQSDIIILPEAFDGAKLIESGVQRQLDALGYKSIAVAYNEKDDRRYQAVVDPHMMLLSKLEIVQHQECRLGDIRTMIMADVVDPNTEQVVRIFGVHLDDRSEGNRLRQVDDLVSRVAESPFPVVLMGDFNAMPGGSFQAKFLKKEPVKRIIGLVPGASTKDILQRLLGMAAGDTIHRIEQSTNLRRSDPRMRPTTTPKMRGQEWMPSIRMVQIDHILVSPEIEVGNFTVARDGGSDHRAISVSVTATRQSMTPVL